MGVTYTGMYEPVAAIAAALDEIERSQGLDVPIHVDGASGAFVAPFLQPELEWDFRTERVVSISTSGHKYGLVYPGVGWVVWRDLEHLPEELIFKVSYLGGEMPTFALNFSRPGAQVLLQYYNFLRLGRKGYEAVQGTCRDVALHLSSEIGAMDAFELWNDGAEIPVFAWRMTEGHTSNWDLYDLSNQLRQRGWLVPAYPMPDDLSDLTVQRIVVRNGLSMDLADELLTSIANSVAYLDGLEGPLPKEGRTVQTFHH
jgi:glutamate decarboxylase